MNSPTSLVANTAEEKRTPKWNAPLRVRQALNLGSRAMDGSGWQWEVTDRHGKLIAAELLREEAERFVLACNSFDALTEANKKLVSALEKLASYPLEDFGKEGKPDAHPIFGANSWELNVGHVRAARFAIKAAKGAA